MSVTGAVIWLIVMAVAVTTVLVVGTLTAADLVPRRRRSSAEPAAGSTDGSDNGGRSEPESDAELHRSRAA